LLDPLFRYELRIIPAALLKEELAETGPVSGGHLKRIGGMDGKIPLIKILAKIDSEILHADGVCDPGLVFLEDLGAGLLLEDRP